MSCREFLSLFLDAWLAGELPARRQRDCADHVATCPSCRDYVAGYRGVVGGLHSLAWAEVDLPPLDAELVREVLARRLPPQA